MPRKPLIALYALTHFWVDLSCAFLMFRVLSGEENFVLLLLLYNFCAFALQMPLGLLADWLDRNSTTAAAGCLLIALSYVTPIPVLTAVTAGVGNALFHLGGGIDTLNAGQKKASLLGVFVSPGAVGLYLGTLWGKGSAPSLWIAPAGLAVLGASILWVSVRAFGSLRSGNHALWLPTAKDCPLLFSLFLVVVLRSYVGMNQVFPWKGTGMWPVVLTLALALGKTAGGFARDAFGERRTAAVSLGLAALLYLASALPLPGTLAVFLFNMTMPLTLWAAANAVPGAKGFTFGLLTFALFIGYLPAWIGWPSLLTSPGSLTAAALLSLGLLWPALGRRSEYAGHLSSLSHPDAGT